MIVFTLFLPLFFVEINANDFATDKQNGYPSAATPSDNWWNWWWSQWWTLWNETINWWTLDEVVTPEKKCNWIKLNTDFPIIWNCIWDKENENSTNAFPTMIWALTKIIITFVLVVCFILIIVSWIMRAWAWEDSSKKTKAKDIIKKVAVTILLLWFSGVILRLINPNFFG